MSALRNSALELRRSPVVAAAATGLVARAVTGVAGLVMLGALARELSAPVFASVAVLTTVQGFLAYADLGLGNGLINRVAAAASSGDWPAVSRDLANALMLATVATLSAAALVILGLVSGWTRDLSAGVGLALDPTTTTAVLLVVLLAVPASLAARVLLGVQKQWVANLVTCAGTGVHVAGVLAAIAAGAGSAVLVGAALAGPLLVGAMCTAAMLRSLPMVRPRLSDVTLTEASSLLRSGVLFLVLGLVGVLAYQIDVIVISRYLTADDVKTYVLVLRLFGLGPVLLGLVLTPLWPRLSALVAVGRTADLWPLFGKAVAMGLALNAAWVATLLAAGDAPYRLLSGEKLDPPAGLIAAFAAWTVLNGLNGPIATILNAMGVIRFQIVANVAMVIANVALSIWLIDRGAGVSGPITATVVCQVLFVIVPSAIFLRSHRARLARGVT